MKNILLKQLIRKSKLKIPDSGATDLLKRLLISVNDVTNGNEISDFIDNMPALDSRFLRACVVGATPNLDMTQLYSCSNCGYESEMEVPLDSGLFLAWIMNIWKWSMNISFI